jgi:hypothetical protein
MKPIESPTGRDGSKLKGTIWDWDVYAHTFHILSRDYLEYVLFCIELLLDLAYPVISDDTDNWPERSSAACRNDGRK